MSAPTPFVRSKYRTLEGGCVSCSGDLATVQSLPGVQNVDALASGVVLVTHDGTVTDDAVIDAARKAGLTVAAAGPARPVRG
ncbi:heavy-metal-associated domain-containing protein [Microbacterium lacticum]|uniref:heavy-metal-associated domain-containing protein n=1 Tax=Microbacterium lacticum TaxID=33885 RepID=UPI001F59B47E|nr:heavy-metal-associated domain-containing protein [Microbacterium lacticum]